MRISSGWVNIYLLRATQKGNDHAKDGDKASCGHNEMKAIHKDPFQGRLTVEQSGIRVEIDYDDIKEGDTIEAYEIVKVKRTLSL